MNGTSIGTWDEAIPAGSESVGMGDDRIRSVKSTLRTALDDEHVWPSTGGIVGQHRAGSARAFYGTQSQVSASTTSVVGDGRVMIASDTSRLFGVGSAGTTLLGGPNVVSVDTLIAFPQRSRWAIEVGVIKSIASTFVVTFPNSGFSGEPFLTVSTYTQAIGGQPATWMLDGLTSSAFSGHTVNDQGQGLAICGIMWMSVGTRAL